MSSRRYPLNIFFFLAGFQLANWTVRIPAVKDQVGASTTELGLALLCLSIGGVLAMSLAGRLCVRVGTRPVNAVAGTLTCGIIVLPALTHSVLGLSAALLIYGLCYGTFNIALNSAAVEVERAAGRPMMSGLHGLYSAGGLCGALVGGFAAGHLPPAEHLAVVAGVGVAIGLCFARVLLRQPVAAPTEQKASDESIRGPLTPIMFFAVVAFCTAFAEFANNDWATLHLRDDLGASASAAAYGYAAYECAITVGRLFGGIVIRRTGELAVLSGGAALATVGILVAAWAEGLPGGLGLAFVAYLAIGLGVANIFPIAIARSGALGGPSAVSKVAPLGSVGILVQRPVVGFLADQIGLPNALATVASLTALACVVGLALRPHLRTRQMLRAATKGPAADSNADADAGGNPTGEAADNYRT